MAGGTFDTQNKTRAGVYIRFRSAQTEFSNGTHGVVAICEPLSWGPVATIVEIDAATDVFPLTGYAFSDSRNRFLQEIFKGSNRTTAPQKVLLYRPTATSSAVASAVIGNLTATAKYAGVRGNDISIAVIANTNSTFTVNTIVAGSVVDSQVVSTAANLVSNAWVIFSGSGALTASSGTALSGGSDGTVAAATYSSFLQALEAYHFDILVYDGTDATTIAAYKNFIERIAAQNGQYAQLVAANVIGADSRFVINVTTGVTLEDGTVLTPAQTCWWVAGIQAGAGYNESLTFARYPGAVSVSPVLSSDAAETAINAGQFTLFADRGVVRVESDIDSLVTVTSEISKVYKKNKTMRLCNALANDIYQEFQDNYIGVIVNNETGRSRFKSAIVGYLLKVQANDGIVNFDPDDVVVSAGTEPDAVVVDIAIQVAGSAEKIYITVEVA